MLSFMLLSSRCCHSWPVGPRKVRPSRAGRLAMHRPSTATSSPPLRLALIFVLLALPLLFARATRALDWEALGPEGGSIVTLALAPGDPSRAWAGGDGGLFRSFDGGASWTSVAVPFTAFAPTAVAVDPHEAARVWVATDGGLWLSIDDGSNFTAAGLDGQVLLSLQIEPGDGQILRAGSDEGAFLSVDGGDN